MSQPAQSNLPRFLRSGPSFAPPVPSWFVAELLLAGGSTPNGKPKFRVVHGKTATDWQGELKYTWNCPDGWDCYVLEEWVPAAFFGSRETWNAAALAQPYPHEGDYIIVFPLVSLPPELAPVPLDNRVIQMVRYLRHAREQMPANDHGVKQMLEGIAETKRQELEAKKATTDDQNEGEWDNLKGKLDKPGRLGQFDIDLTREYTKPEYIKAEVKDGDSTSTTSEN